SVPRLPPSGGLGPPWAAPARPEHRLVAASQQSLQASIASLPLQSSLMSKTYLKSDHFSGGGSSSVGRSCRTRRIVGLMKIERRSDMKSVSFGISTNNNDCGHSTKLRKTSWGSKGKPGAY